MCRYVPSILLSLLLLAGAAPACAAIIHVPADQPTIQAGIDVAGTGDTVLVAPGTYTGTGNRDLDTAGKAVLVRASAGPEQTIIDCQGAAGDPHRGFRFHTGETGATVIDGFTIRNGRLDPSPPMDHGGAILFESASSPAVTHCIVSDNQAQYGCGMAISSGCAPAITNCTLRHNGDNASGSIGGGMFVDDGATPTIGDCIFEHNMAEEGGGVFGRVDLTGCDFIGNWSLDHGGAIYGGGSFVSCTFTGNQSFEGGGIYVYFGGGDGAMTDCVFSDNSAGAVKWHDGALAVTGCSFSGNATGLITIFVAVTMRDCEFVDNVGGGIRSTYSTGTIEDCLFSGNTAGRGGGAFFEGAAPTLSHCVFSRNTAGGAGGRGGGIYCEDELTLRYSTMHGNSAGGNGGGLYLEGPAAAVVENSIIGFSDTGEAVYCEAGAAVSLSCCDLYGNAGGDWIGCIAGQQGVAGNFRADPLYCDAAADDFTLQAASPCAPANSPAGCGLIGALPVDCGATAVELTTWGAVKAAFR